PLHTPPFPYTTLFRSRKFGPWIWRVASLAASHVRPEGGHFPSFSARSIPLTTRIFCRLREWTAARRARSRTYWHVLTAAEANSRSEEHTSELQSRVDL